MPSITVKNIPEELYEKIRESASVNRRSINNEIIFRLKQNLIHAPVDPEEMLSRIDQLRRQISLPALTDKILKEAKDYGRP